jgi:hypothetical protein
MDRLKQESAPLRCFRPRIPGHLIRLTPPYPTRARDEIMKHYTDLVTEDERSALLSFVRAEKVKAVSMDRVNKLALLEAHFVELPKLLAARQ